MSAPVSDSFGSDPARRPAPPAGTPGTEGDAAHSLDVEQLRPLVDAYPSHDDRVKHWSEADRVAFLRRVQRVDR